MGHKRALIVGINYIGTGNDLQGCINDANNMYELVTDHFGFTDVKMLLEQDATTDNIKSNLRWLVSGCRPGDTLLFHYSGHGSQIADTSDPDHEPDQLDEIICPIDLDWKEKVITDDYMKWVFDTVPAGVNLVVILDSCHSGGALDQTNQYQPEVSRVSPSVSDVPPTKTVGRYLPPPPDVQAMIDSLSLPVAPRLVQSRDVDQTGVLIAGCRSDQTSADAYINGQYQGAGTGSLISSLSKRNYKMTAMDLITEMNRFMVDHGFTQRPELDGSTAWANVEFLAEPVVSSSVVDAYEPPDLPPAPSTTQTSPVVAGSPSIATAAIVAVILALLALIQIIR